ncbi:MAG: hypothetical protein K8F25_03495, partial [Fimbriimonadaceae bacterium]|nr:hypothetical protein [Alphaproteobacteria bacterium]
YVYLVREIGFEKKFRPLQIILFGILPPVMAAIALGGRTPILYGLLLMLLALTIKKTVGRRLNYEGPQTRNLKLYYIVAITFGLLSLAAIYYFAQVFVVRAIESGGIRFMFDYAENYWGIKFSGNFADFIIQLLGQELTYVVFVFSWYFSQGLLMSNYLFSGYDGPMLLGVYGIDLIAAIMRRLNGDFVAHGYDLLLKINVYGFFPSAFGSLYVDVKFLGLPVSLVWGWFAGVVYRKNLAGNDLRWWLLMPFVVLGIVFSLINTPLGFSNGFVTHIWLAIGFFTSSRIIGTSPEQ